MPNVAMVLKQEIARVARREIRSHTRGLRKTATQGRRDIAELKRQATKLEGIIGRIERMVRKGDPAQAGEDHGGAVLRFKAQGVRAQRRRLGVSAAEYAKLLGVTAHTVYKWEHGAARPRKRLLAKLATLRAMGKREAAAKLSELGRKAVRRRKKT